MARLPRRFVIVGWTLVGLIAAGLTHAFGPDESTKEFKATDPIAPVLPRNVVGPLEEGRYADAVAAIDALIKPDQPAADRAYLGLVKAIAARLSGSIDASRETLQNALKADSKGVWSGRIRFELAALELAAARPVEAEALARAEVETLLDPARKDRLAKIVSDFARVLIAPKESLTPADPNAAHDLFARARELAQGAEIKARLLYEMASLSRIAGNPQRAIEELNAYLKEYPKEDGRPEARFLLGESQLTIGWNVAARMTWADLARDLRDKPEARFRNLRASALYQITRTHGTPHPPNDVELNLAIAATRRFLEDAPEHPLAVKAAYELGEAAQSRAKTDRALEFFKAFLADSGFKATTDAAKRDRLELGMSATFQIALILQTQEKYDDAIAAWKGYLAQYPDGPQSADARRAIVDTQYMIAQFYDRKKQFDRARSAYASFVAENPLDLRAPQTYFELGRIRYDEKKYDEAISAWNLLAGKFPKTEAAEHALFSIAQTLETEKGDLTAAIEQYRKVTVEPWSNRARTRIAVMEARELTVITPRTFRSGETPILKIHTRNLDKLTFTAYKLDAESYFRKKNTLRGVESLDIGLVAPDAEWTIEVPGRARYKPIEHDYELPKATVPGVWVVKVSDEKTLQATSLVLGSDIDAIVKASRDQTLFFVQDMKTGKGRAGARVLVVDSTGLDIDLKTDRDGVLLVDRPRPRDPNSRLSYLIIDGENVAGSVLSIPGTVAQGLSPRAYILTDRPAYRPGNEVEIKGVVRQIKDGRYANSANDEYTLHVVDPLGRVLLDRRVRLSEFGTFHDRLSLDSAAPLGTYRIGVSRPGFNDPGGSFEVQEYRLEKIDLAIQLKKSVVYRGDKVEAEAIARYRYGTPVVGHEIVVRLPDGRSLTGSTDAAGKYRLEFETDGFAEDQALNILAQLPQDGVNAYAIATLATRGFEIELSTDRDVFLDGETIALEIKTKDAAGKPIGEKLVVEAIKRLNEGGRTVERASTRIDEIRTDATTGEARASIRIDDPEGGAFVLRVSGIDRFGAPIVSDKITTISGENDPARLRILSDRTDFRSGETAKVNLHARDKGGVTLLAWEADRILMYKIVNIKEGDNEIEWKVNEAQFPNFTLTATRMIESRHDYAALDIKVERDLRIKIVPRKSEVRPGEAVEVDVTTTDQLGRPVSAEIAVALVDRALLRLFERQSADRPGIAASFYHQTRTRSFTTQSTNVFLYAAATVPVVQAIVDEENRIAAQLKNAAEAKLGDVDFAKDKEGGERFGMIPALGAAAPADALARGEDRANSGGAMEGGRGAEMNQSQMMGGMAGAKNAIVESRRSAVSNTFPQSKGMTFRSPPEDGDRRLRSMKSERAAGDAAGKLDEALALDMTRIEKDGKGLGEARTRFVETAYWNPNVITAADGKATFRFEAPSALSNYQFHAWGVDAVETLVGEARADLAIKKPFLVDLKLPSILVEGDKPRLIAEIHHAGIAGELKLSLKAYAGEREQVFPKTLDLKKDGVDQVVFEPIDIPAGDIARFTLSGRCGDASDELIAEVPIRPWGVDAIASASGSSSDDRTEIVALPEGRSYENPEMSIVVAPTASRMLIDEALGGGFGPPWITKICRIRPVTTLDVAGELIAASSVLGYVNAIGGATVPEVSRLSERVRGLGATLTSLQNKADGGWPWIAAKAGEQPRPSDIAASARVVWALAEASNRGLGSDPAVLERGVGFLQGALTRVDQADHDTRGAIVFALSARGRASFEQINAQNRIRDALSSKSLAYLALSFANLDRASMAEDSLKLLAAKGKSEAAKPGEKPRMYWTNAAGSPDVDTTGLATLAFARVRPAASERSAGVSWLLAHRAGGDFQPIMAKGPALAALALDRGRAGSANDRYKLAVVVNETEVYRGEVAGSTPRIAIAVPRKAIKAGGANRVRFDIEGRGVYGYEIVLAGFTRDFKPDQNRSNRKYVIQRKVYLAPDRELDGKPLPSGFGVSVNANPFDNKVSKLALGGGARVHLEAYRTTPYNQPVWKNDYLVIEDRLPAGTTVVEGSVRSQSVRHEIGDGSIVFYFAPDQFIGNIDYDIYGYIPGKYRVPPPRIASANDPGAFHLGAESVLEVLDPGVASDDSYKPTPDESFARGKLLFEKGRYSEAAPVLDELFAGYSLRDEIAKEAARMLLLIHAGLDEPRKIVRYFEILREKSPESALSFDVIKAVGKAYRDINEHERAYLIWRAMIESSYLDDAKVGETLRSRGSELSGIAYLIALWREYPALASIEVDALALSQTLANLANRGRTDAATRRTLLDAKITSTELIIQSNRLLRVFLTLSPRNPVADEAGLALLANDLEIGDDRTVVALAERLQRIHPKSRYLDGFQYAEALGRFHLGEYDRAIELADRIANSTYKDANGNEIASANKWEAIYIKGQILDARRRPAEALPYYEKVADRYLDAAAAIRSWKRIKLELAESTVARPQETKPGDPKPASIKTKVKLDYRNIGEIDLKVYPVDLMRLYLARKNLNDIAAIDLSGIKPAFAFKKTLGKGADFEDQSLEIPLELPKEGAYLVMVRGDNRHTSGIVVVSPLEIEGVEDSQSSSVRVTVRDARTKNFVPGAQVKVIGSNDANFTSGETDLRGVFLAEGVSGRVAVIARKDENQYAFYRGTIVLGARDVVPQAAGTIEPFNNTFGLGVPAGQTNQGMFKRKSLEGNIQELNNSNQIIRMRELQNRNQQGGNGVQIQKAR